MGQALEKFRGGRQWRDKKMREICNMVFDRIVSHSKKASDESEHVLDESQIYLEFKDLYIATLLVYNEINKRLPGPHHDPPSKERVQELITESDINVDGKINREEFVTFIKLLTSDTIITVSQGLILTLLVAPTVAMVTKKSTEGVPGVGKLVQKLPTSIYASVVTLAVLLFQNSQQEAL